MNTLDVLMYGQRTIRSTVDRYGPDDWTRIAHGVWTAKDLLGHLGAFEVRFADQLAPFAAGVPLEGVERVGNSGVAHDRKLAVEEPATSSSRGLKERRRYG